MLDNLKYTIKKKILQLDDKPRNNLYRLAIYIDRSIQTIEDWQNLKQGDQRSISTDDLYKLAEFFNCQPFELINGKAAK